MHIMDMTLRQILQTLPHHPLKVIMFLLFIDNILVSACASAGWMKAETFFLQFSKFLYAIIAAIGKKLPTMKVSPVFFISMGLLFCIGCASAGMNSSCGRIVGNQVTIPYVGGKADGNVFACH